MRPPICGNALVSPNSETSPSPCRTVTSPDPVASASYIHTIPNNYSQYTSLDQAKGGIRLLRIETFFQENQITCSIVRTSLTDYPPFTALADCWADLEETISISVYFDGDQKIDSSWTSDRSERT
jgi:hypothetical protein